MAHYKTRLTADLERWIEGGFVPAANRDAILASVPDPRRVDGATTLAFIGALLFGLAVIAFIAANWGEIPRLVRFGALLLGIAASAGGAAWAAERSRLITSNALLTVAALIFAASIGLTGQIFDLTGDPQTALYAAGAGAALLAIAGRSTGAAVAAIALFMLGDGTQAGSGHQLPWALFAGLAGIVASVAWRSTALAHAGALAVGVSAAYVIGFMGGDASQRMAVFVLSLVFAGLAWLAQSRSWNGRSGVFFGWAVLAAMGYFVVSGLFELKDGLNILHRLAWIVVSGGLIAVGRMQNHRVVSGIGVLNLMAAIGALLVDLGLDLLSAAGVFGLGALIALGAGLALRGRKPA
jgi:uncharacterized membrane protein